MIEVMIAAAVSLSLSIAGVVVRWFRDRQHVRSSAGLEHMERRLDGLLEEIGSKRFDVLYSHAGRVVIRAFDDSQRRSVIIKLAEPGAASAHSVFVEAQALSELTRLGYPFCADLIAVRPVEDRAIALVISDLPGDSLQNYLSRMFRSGVSPSVRDVVQVSTRLAESVAYLHRLGWIHGDLKPANVLMQFEDRRPFACVSSARLIDFESAQPSRDLASQRDRIGTIGFMAPERLFSGRPLAQSDVYSLAAMTAFLLTGEPGCLASERLSEVPAPLRSLLQTALQPDPRDRPLDAGVWVSGLVNCMRELAPHELASTAKWSRDWANAPALTQTIGGLNLARHALHGGSDEDDTLTRIVAARLLDRVKDADRALLASVLGDDQTVADYALRMGASQQEIRDQFGAASVSVQAAVEGWLSSPTQLRANASLEIGGVAIPLSSAVTIGRDPSPAGPDELVYAIHDPLLNRSHVRIFTRKGKVFCLDLGTTNGTAVKRIDGQEVSLSGGVEVEIVPGETVQIGDSTIEVKQADRIS